MYTDSFLVIGSGSAGRRHARALQEMFPSARVTIVRRFNSPQPDGALDGLDVEVVGTIAEGLRSRPEVAIIASAATNHLADYREIVGHVQQVLIEKPISANVHHGLEIQRLALAASLKTYVGYHLRFSETPLAFYSHIKNQSWEKISLLSLRYGQHLRFWRPNVDMKETVTAQRVLGGGVLRELSHEIDAMYFLGSNPNQIKSAKVGFGGVLDDLDVETSATFTVGGIEFDTEIHLDMTAEQPFRKWEAHFDGYTVCADLLAGQVSKTYADGSHEVLTTARPDERNVATKMLLRSFLGVGGGNAISVCTVGEAVKVLQLVESVERSASTGTEVFLGI